MTLALEALRPAGRAGRTGRRSSTASTWRWSRGACSASSASRAAARRPRRWRCSGTRGRARGSPRAASRSRASGCRSATSAPCGARAAARSRTSPRIRPRRSTRRCGSAAPCRRCSTCTAAGAGREVADLLSAVGLPGDEGFQRRYPHEVSGGQRQRVAIATALACEPRVVVLDEPTTGLDVITQARVLDEIRRIQAEFGIALVYVSHDLAVVAEVADEIAVLYAGRVVEHATTAELIARPRHPYTRGLLNSIPDHALPRRLVSMRGISAGVGAWPAGLRLRAALRPGRARLLRRAAAAPRHRRILARALHRVRAHAAARARRPARARPPLPASRRRSWRSRDSRRPTERGAPR